MEPWNTPAVARLVELALEEDTGRGDLTTAAVVPEGARARARAVARQPLVVAGTHLFERVLQRVEPGIQTHRHCRDGEAATQGTALLSVDGPARAILTAERTALNFLQRLSGVATLTRRFVEQVAGTRARITDTRKTTPGLRALEKYAVRMGGGANHRGDLASGVLIKDNHVAVVGSVREAVRRARLAAPHGMKIEVEVDDAAQLDEALDAGADVVLLDNFGIEDIERAVEVVRAQAPRTLIEVSGGVRLETAGAIARLGVDLISVGALTHSAPAVDIALDFELLR